MTVEFTYYCDAPARHEDEFDEDGERRDHCPGHASTMLPQPHMPFGMLHVREEHPGQLTELHFCDWDCLLRYCATFPPTERIPL